MKPEEDLSQGSKGQRGEMNSLQGGKRFFVFIKYWVKNKPVIWICLWNDENTKLCNL